MAQQKRNENLGVGIALTVLVPFLGAPILATTLAAADANLETATNWEANAKARVPILNEKSALVEAYLEKQKKHVIAVEGDIRALGKLVSETKKEQKKMQELMKRVKDNLVFLSKLGGKGEVMKNMTIGNTLLLPVINVMLDFVSYIQTHDSRLDWSSMRSELDAFKSSTDFLSIEVKHQFVMDLSDFY